MKRDVVGAPFCVCFGALREGVRPPKAHYVINYRPRESMFVVPSADLVVVVYSVSFQDPIEQAIAKVFLQEIEISRKQSKDLATAPSVTYTQEPPHDLKMLRLDVKTSEGFVGFVSLGEAARRRRMPLTGPSALLGRLLTRASDRPRARPCARAPPLPSMRVRAPLFLLAAISKRNVEGDKLQKVISLVEGYRSYLMYHVQGTKSQLHTRIRNRSTNWLQV